MSRKTRVFLLGLVSPMGHTGDLGLRVAPGFRVTLYADENLANDIFAMTLDAQGRLRTRVYASGFSSVSGLALDSLGTLYAGDDPSGGLMPLSGHIWSIASATAPAPAPVLAPITVPGARPS